MGRENPRGSQSPWPGFPTPIASLLGNPWAAFRDSLNTVLLHLVQVDYFQHRGGREGPEVKPALARVDDHLAAIMADMARS
jgi:hypothetical protein